ncbi:MAG: ankyrin repeat domain-containing protein [Dysgonomonas sp.]|nr:ankyrin repeat domain-containing protein [Dysgonomonas sp.]
MKRTFNYSDDKSSKFWSIDISENTFTVNYGKIGTAGQTQTKTFADEEACQKEANKLIAEKTKKGYIETSSASDSSIVNTSPAPNNKKEKPKTEQKSIELPAAELIPVAIHADFNLPDSYWKVIVEKDSSELKIRHHHSNWCYNTKILPSAKDAIIDAAQLIVDKLENGFVFDEGEMVMPDGSTMPVNFDTIKALAASAPKLPKIGSIVNYDPGNLSHTSTYIKAIRSGNTERVKLLLDRGASATEKIQTSKSKTSKPFEVAVESKQKDIISLFLPLIEHPYIVYRLGGYDSLSILSYAFRDIDEEATKTLLDAGYPIEKDTSIFYWLSHASLSQDLVNHIIEKADPTHDKGYAVLEALKQDKPDLAIQILDRGVTADISQVDHDYLEYTKTPLIFALEHFPDNLALFEKLIEKGADISAGDESHATPLDYALLGKGSPEVRDLLRKSATAAHAFANEKEAELHAFVKTGVDYGWGDRTAYHRIIELLDAGVDPNCKDGYGCTPLHYALAKQIPCFIKELLQYGADPNARDNEGRTPLFYYHRSYGGNGSIISEFVKSGADVNAIDNHGRTILMHTTTIKDDHDMRSVMETFLWLKADVTSTDPNGNTYMHYAALADVGIDAENIIGGAVNNGADLNAINNEGYAPLHLMVKAPKDKRHTFHDSMIRHMLSFKADVNVQDNEGNTPIHLTAYPSDDYGDLISGNPDLMIKNNAGKTALECIKENGYYEGRLKKEIDSLLEEAAAGGRQLPPLQWIPQSVNPDAPTPTELNIVSAMLITDNDADDHLVFLGDNKFGIVGNIPGAATIVDSMQGQIIWHLNKCYDGDGGAPIADEEAIYVAREDCGSRYLTAHEPATGAEIWRCGLSSSYMQFGTIFVQTKQFLIHANISAKKIYVVDKTKGKTSARIPMAHPVKRYGRRDLFTCKDNLFFFGMDEKKGEYVLDYYDPEAKTFVSTIHSFGENMPFADCVYDDYLYVLVDDGCLYKIELPSGNVVNVVDHCPEIEHTFSGSKALNMDADCKLHYILSSECGQYNALHTYDVSTDKLETIHDLKEMKSELHPRAATSDRYVYLFGRHGNTGREIEIYDAQEQKMIAKMKLPNHGGYDWQEHALVVGDSIYVIQRGGDEYGDNSVLYRIQ